MNDQLAELLRVVFAAMFNHLWQSTLFAVAMAGLALLLRKYGARVRYVLWLAASLKFLVPFALLAALGTLIPWHPAPGESDAAGPGILVLAGDFAAPMSGDLTYPQPFAGNAGADQADAVGLLMVAGLIVWVIGVLFVAGRWLLRWSEVRRALRASVLLTGIDFPAPVRSTTRQFEPGVVGIRRPVLLLPQGIEERLTPGQMRAVLAHERCHLRWRDNLAAAVHMRVEALFWFHPLVWWIGARLIKEREQACDEQVIRDGNPPQCYAEGILAVCEHYIASRLPSVSGVSGADLRQRVQSILRNTLALKLDRPRKLALAVLAGCAVAAPIAAGVLSGNAVQMLFSSAYSAGTIGYWKLLSAQLEVGNCRAPGPEFHRRRAALAATAAKLSAGDGDKVLLFAVAGNSTGNAQRLLAEGAVRSGDGFMDSNALMAVAARLADVPMLELLARAGFSVDERGTQGIGNSGNTPLMVAISQGRTENVDWLIRHGADVNATDRSGMSPLVNALVSCGGQPLVTRLIEAGAVPSEKARRIARNRRFDLGPTTVRSMAAAPLPPLPSATPAAPVTGRAPAVLTAEQLRQRWQRPTAAELDAQPWRAESPTRHAEARADFDGDGREDHAVLFMAVPKPPEGVTEGLFVQLSSLVPDTWLPVAQVVHTTQTTTLEMGMSIAPPGTYATACGKGYWTCAADEPRELILKRPAISYFRPESASSLVYWDEAAGKFRQVWDSD